METIYYIDGNFVNQKEAFVSVLDLSIMRGYAVFDYVQLYKGRPFHLMDHLLRLDWSAKKVGINLPKSFEEIEKITSQLITKNGPINAGVRYIVTGGISGLDQLLPTTESSLIIFVHPFSPYKPQIYKKGMRAITNRELRYLPNVKTTNYMPAILGMKKAQEKGYDDALYIERNEELLEGTSCNLFFIKNGVLITDNSDRIVKGVTRDIILNLAKNYFPIEYRAVSLDEVSSCEEAFLTSSVKDVVPLVQIDNLIIGNGRPGKLSSSLRSLYHKYIENYFLANLDLKKNIFCNK